ncbi:MAG: 2-phospho-L-lactate transferase [Nitrospinaceae bacterium]|jgi:LPPG:FO 2-phospho-L-lactate transferase|nr:2-phospho-L-lactate transferase [Nitrospinaceae bacterium]MBT3435493.1 2-phospho-L-lactate transferase [Nitrospinaceae bacterium]MBT3822863.1 2-phospho-L-lactate transferase [Nitrospinaceae bacterium]MBT4094593.1 2-phospho-L-lactate transferase [Nitrospinaceae bacterium]MBT4430554.1 2-phospho-L-lactate transferase [Nitrospinaceae bacterium]
MSAEGPVVALAGGVGGAKLAVGLAKALPSGALTVIVNTADDLTLHGLHISPDLDTVMYNLAGLSDPSQGWGIKGDTYGALDLLGLYGGPTWFRLGDKDMATHIRRTQRLSEGTRLTVVTAELCAALDIKSRVLPMTDSPVATRVQTPEGELEFQDYFVARGTRPKVTGVRFQGADEARATPEVLEAIGAARTIVYCPSNPMVSLGPILAIKDISEKLQNLPGIPRVGVSPIIGGAALRGPAADMLNSLGHEVSALGVAEIMREYLDGYIFDDKDTHLMPSFEERGIAAMTAQSVMTDTSSKTTLARVVLDFADKFRDPPPTN